MSACPVAGYGSDVPLMWITLALVAWVVLSLPVAVATGQFLRRG